uniref:Uncharacterized protein n=1 Tax=Caenorhabditis japonica TaxID=281687 RepID=A0A8R1IRN3_CAEJA
MQFHFKEPTPPDRRAYVVSRRGIVQDVEAQIHRTGRAEERRPVRLVTAPHSLRHSSTLWGGHALVTVLLTSLQVTFCSHS